MTEQSTYRPPPPFTQQEIDDLVSFIQDRVKPLRDAAGHRSEDFKAFQGILSLVPFMKGVAMAEIQSGHDPSTIFHALRQIADQWDDHPDFQPSWAVDYERS